MKKNMNTTTPEKKNTTPAPVDTIPTTTTENKEGNENTMKNTPAANIAAAPIVTTAPATLYTLTPYGTALVTLRKEGGSHTITATAADTLLSVSIDEYRAPFVGVRTAAVTLDNVQHTTPAATPAAVAAAEDALSAALRAVYTRAAEDLFPDREDMRYCVLSLNTLKKAKDVDNGDGTFTKGTRDFRAVSDLAYVKAIENLIATRLMGQKWDADLNNFRTPTPEEEEKTRARIARYHEKKEKKSAKTAAPAKEKKTPAKTPAKNEKKKTPAKTPAKNEKKNTPAKTAACKSTPAKKNTAAKK